jgi:hypothetical protein
MGTDRAANDVQITPVMIERGVSALRGEMVGGELGVSRQFLEDAVIRVFQEMARGPYEGNSQAP